MKYFILLFTLLIHGYVYGQSYFKGPALIEGVTQVSTAGGTTTLTKDSQTVQSFIGTLTQIVKLPDATTLPLGRYFELYNDSTDAVTVNDNGNNTVRVLRPSTSIKIIVKDVSTSDGDWIIQKIDNNLPPLSAGKYLTNDGTDTSWADVDALPAQSGNAGKYLTTDGTDTSWADVDALPAQSGNAGKYLTTDGTDTSWGILTLQTTYLESIQPQITLNSTQGGLLLRDASTPIGATLFAVQDNAGTTSYLGVDVNGLSSTNLTMTGTTGAVKLHNLTTAQRNALTPAAGMMIYNTDTARFECYVASWTPCGGGGILTVVDKTEREAIESGERYDGLFVFQKDSLTLWQLQGGITDDKWVIQDLGLRRKSGTELQEFSSAGEVALLPVMTQRVLLAGDGGSYAVTLPTPDFEGQRVLVIGMSNEFPVTLAGIDFTENRNRWFQSVGGAWIMEGL